MNAKSKPNQPGELDRARLLKFLRLLSSDQIGERASAAMKAAELVARFGGWERFIQIQPTPNADQQRDAYERAKWQRQQNENAAREKYERAKEKEARQKKEQQQKPRHEAGAPSDEELLSAFAFAFPNGETFAGLSAWERNFLNGCRELVDAGGGLSIKQREIIVRLIGTSAAVRRGERRPFFE